MPHGISARVNDFGPHCPPGPGANGDDGRCVRASGLESEYVRDLARVSSRCVKTC